MDPRAVRANVALDVPTVAFAVKRHVAIVTPTTFLTVKTVGCVAIKSE